MLITRELNYPLGVMLSYLGHSLSLGIMTNYWRMVPCRPICRQLANLPKKYFSIENLEATMLTTTTRRKFIDELPDEINNKIWSFMCGKDLLKMKGVWNKTGKVVSCDKLVQFKIVLERLDGIIKGLKSKETKNEQKFILRNRVKVGEERGYIVEITSKFVHVVLEVGIFTATPTIRKCKNEIPTHLGPFVGFSTYDVINWSGYHYGGQGHLIKGKSNNDGCLN